LSFGLSNALSFGLNYWFLLGIFNGIAQERIADQDRRIANQGIHRSLRNSIIIGIIGGIIIGSMEILSSELSARLGDWLIYGPRDGLNGLSFDLDPGLLMGISSTLLICMVTGGLAVWRHYVIRFLLWRSHTFPKQVQFLDDTRARFLLRRVGGGYSFTHRLLLDHFTKVEIEAPSSPAASIRANFSQHKTTSLFIIPFLSVSDSDLACTKASPHPYGE
jgi:hypothetical protein